MKNSLAFVLSITIINSLGIGCKKEPTETIQSNIRASISGNNGCVMCKKSQIEPSVKPHKQKGKSPNVNKLTLSELGSNDIREVRNNAVFKTDIKNQTFIDNNGNLVYIDRKRISKRYDFAILENRKDINEIFPVATAKGRSQEEMANIARSQKWSDDVINKIKGEDY